MMIASSQCEVTENLSLGQLSRRTIHPTSPGIQFNLIKVFRRKIELWWQQSNCTIQWFYFCVSISLFDNFHMNNLLYNLLLKVKGIPTVYLNVQSQLSHPSSMINFIGKKCIFKFWQYKECCNANSKKIWILPEKFCMINEFSCPLLWTGIDVNVKGALLA